ncbi:MAG TPA: class I SAM-dependent methyltransferase [Candidatus Bathyarchaeia archaeon]|nr:class I SAM-dependent methyltransferase [Candidatus Bathyarchaeia archaeon]
MYEKSGAYYDAIYSFKDYKKESEKLVKIINKHKTSNGTTLLDVACGTGNHITFLKPHYRVEGLDISPALLRQARAKHRDVAFHKGDMCTFKLGKTFDIVTCLFSAIGHVKSKEKMRKAVANMAQHLKPGGILIVEPWFSPAQWAVGHISANFVDKPDLKIARLSKSERRGNLSVNRMHHLVASPIGVDYFVERLELGLFTSQQYLGAFQKVDLETIFDPIGLTGRGLYIGVKSLV